jgi:hypothetical protein
MTHHLACFDHMLAAWNETQPEAIRAHLGLALTADVVFIDPTIVTTGIDQFEANVRDFRKKFAGARCVRTSGLDTHHDLFRYSWEIRRDSQLLVQGIDIVSVHPTHRVQRVLGFFGPLPAMG